MNPGSMTEKVLMRAMRDLKYIERATQAKPETLRQMAKEIRGRLDGHMTIIAAERVLP